MSQVLRDVLAQHADTATPPRLDLDAIVRAGETRASRRRLGMGVGSVAAVLVLGFGGSALVGLRSDPTPDHLRPTVGAFRDRLLTYAVGSTIFYGDQRLDVAPYRVSTMVQTQDGFVFTDKAGDIAFTDGHTVQAIGRTNLPYGRLLAADPAGSYVGWVDTDATPAPQFVVYDTSTREEVVRNSERYLSEPASTGEFAKPMMEAIDGDHAYWHSPAGTTSWDLTANTGRVVAPNTDSQWLVDAADGQLVHTSDNGEQVIVSADPNAKAPAFPGSFARLSPHARYISTDISDQVRVFDVANGHNVTPQHPDHPFIAVTSWLDDDRFVALGIAAGNDESDPLDLLTCSVSSQQCEVAAAGVASVNELAVLIGQRIAD